MEVTVVMMISAVVIMLTYTCYEVIIKAYQDFKKRQERTTELSELDHVLRRDLAHAIKLLSANNGVTFESDSISVQYTFLSTGILRSSNRTDTFKVNTADLHLFFKGSPLQMENDTPQLIDRLNFMAISDTNKIPYHYSKQYSAEDLIQYQQHAQH